MLPGDPAIRQQPDQQDQPRDGEPRVPAGQEPRRVRRLPQSSDSLHQQVQAGGIWRPHECAAEYGRTAAAAAATARTATATTTTKSTAAAAAAADATSAAAATTVTAESAAADAAAASSDAASAAASSPAGPGGHAVQHGPAQSDDAAAAGRSHVCPADAAATAATTTAAAAAAAAAADAGADDDAGRRPDEHDDAGRSHVATAAARSAGHDGAARHGPLARRHGRHGGQAAAVAGVRGAVAGRLSGPESDGAQLGEGAQSDERAVAAAAHARGARQHHALAPQPAGREPVHGEGQTGQYAATPWWRKLG